MRCSLMLAFLTIAPAVAVPPPNYWLQWQQFKQTFGKHYDQNGDDELKRFNIFKANVDFIRSENAKGLSYELGVNQFADLTSDEFATMYMGWKKPADMWGAAPRLGNHTPSGRTLASSVDWTTQGAVTPVKNQGQCGSCWAFSTTGSLEGAWEIATGKLVSLSEQQFVDCAGSFGNQGCQGGLMDNGFKYAEQAAICTEESYAYTGSNGHCHASSCTDGIPQGGVTGYKDVTADDEQAMMDAVAQQPVSVAIEADKSVFQLYKSGVLSSNCGSSLDHGVLAVGYGTENGQDFWKVKNSWGPTWGDEGFVKLARGKSGSGECGIKSQASYPVVQPSLEVIV